ncbi:sulfotransferase family protein [Marinobacter sp. AN1]|uniref:sulfotransferase family protein n=1 Tax=Marinobacter sp. AN1 TaxID=2886046 RepID=UPI00223150F9|nr:sulfotransferase [Marinobacter sp. AN1]UZD64730.1 sulfotransferase [Marinobacter sp. AN1]
MDRYRFVFILGVGRSGTSLLQSMFAANKFVRYLPETAFIRRYLASGRLRKIYRAGGLEAVKSDLANDRLLNRTGVDFDVILDGAESGSFADVAKIFVRIADSFCDGEASWLGDKDPRLVEFIPLLPLLALNTTALHIIRDPRDVLLSKKKADWSRTSHVWKHIFANRVQLKLGVVSGPKALGPRYHEVIYEELIADPEPVLRELCAYIGLPFDSAMLDFGDAAKKLVSKEEVSWKKETFGPLLSDNKEKWREGLSAREIVLTELCCRQAFRIGGYQFDPRPKSLSIRDRLWVLVGASAIMLMDWPYRLYRGYSVKRACKKLT